MSFEIETTYNRESMDAMNRLAEKTIRPDLVWFRMACLILGVGGLAFGAYQQVVLGEAGKSTASICYGIGLVLLLMGIFWHSYFLNYKAKGVTAGGVKTYSFEFEENFFTSDHPEMLLNYPYSKFQYLCENDRWMVLFSDKRTGIILDKTGFVEGDPEAFGPFLEAKTGLTITKV